MLNLRGIFRSFFLIVCLCGMQVREDNPDAGFGQIQKILGEKWKEVTPEDKARFEEEANKDKVRYKQEMDAYKLKQQAIAEGNTDTKID